MHTSVRNFGCPCAWVNQKSCRTTKNTDAVVRRTTINFEALAVNSTTAIIVYLVPCTGNQNFRRTTRNGNLVIRGTTIYFSLIRTLQRKFVRITKCTFNASSDLLLLELQLVSVDRACMQTATLHLTYHHYTFYMTNSTPPQTG